MKVKELRPLFTAQDIAKRIAELAEEIDAIYGNEPVVVVGVLKGAFIFHADVARALKNPSVELDFLRVSSYGSGATSSRTVTITKDIEVDIENKHVLLVEDIIDSGHSMRFLQELFAMRPVRSFRSLVLLDKKERREVDVCADFVAFSIDEGFVVGYGLDYAEHYRQLPDVCILVPEEEI